jgi:RND family efflux transporter MFP subunit
MRFQWILFRRSLLLLTFFALAPCPCPGDTLEAVTKPSADIELSFVRPGRVAEVPVKEGDAVKGGQLLARQDDQVEQIQLLQLKSKAENKTRIHAAEAEMLQKEEDLKKMEGAKKKGAATDWEVEHARLNVVIARLTLQLAKFEHEQDRRKYEEAKADIERLRLVSPLNGLVEDVTIEPGESAQPLKPVVRVVQVNPLWIDVIAPLSLARNLIPGRTAYILFPGHGASESRERVKGRINFVSVVARAGSDTLRVRVEVENPQRRPAGERVGVRFATSEVTGP